MFIYKAMRHYAPIEAEYETLDEAVGRASADIESDAAWPVEVVDETGAVVLSGDDLHARAVDLPSAKNGGERAPTTNMLGD